MALKREIAAAVAIPVVLGILFFCAPIVFNLLVAVIALAAVWEFCRLAERTGHPVSKTVAMAGSAVLLFWMRDFALSDVFGTPWTLLVGIPMALVFLSCVAPLVAGVDPRLALAGAASTFFSVACIAAPAMAICYLRNAGASWGPPSLGRRAILFLFLIVWGCDSAAYYVGKNLGRHKLAPEVSPNKTWEGAIGGLLGATLIGAVFGGKWILPELDPIRGALAGALASTAGQFGDLFESMWKRGAGVKDSGTFLPGHGGFYDRIDSLLFAGPVLAAFVAALP
ncbi:MAG: phosphatidate cytidylyltransferase [Thermoanaerobaculia bacterium]